MKNVFNRIFFGKYIPLIMTAVSAVSVLFNYSFRYGYVFIDNTLFNGFSLTLFIIAVVNTVFLLTAAVLKLKNSLICNNKIFKTVLCISELFAVFFAVVIIVNAIVNGSESNPVALKLGKEALPVWSAVVGIAVSLFIIPALNNEKVKNALKGIIAVILIVVVYSQLFPVFPYKFSSLPVVFDNGYDYSVVFSTNDTGTAYIEYDYNGESIKKFDEDNGRKKNSRIHTIRVPYEQLSGNTYRVGSERVIDELSYGGRTGKNIESDYITFNDTFGDDIDVLTVSDWHTHNDIAKSAISYLGEYNAVILLGDSAPGMMFEDEAIEYILSFASDISKGEMPIIFARGNHETRGRAADELSSYLGIESFYYTAKLGNYNFIVLDSGEDKKDDHPEYGNMVSYEQNRKNMVNWLCSLENNNEKTIALSHSDEICIEEALSQTAHTKLEELGTSLLVSGHWHETQFKQDRAYPVLIDGGINADGNGSFVASKMSLSSEKIELTSISSDGETTISEEVYWK